MAPLCAQHGDPTDQLRLRIVRTPVRRIDTRACHGPDYPGGPANQMRPPNKAGPVRFQMCRVLPA